MGDFDFTDDEVVETYQASQAEQIQNLNAVIIQLRAELVLRDRKLKGMDSKKEALDSALERISGVDKVIAQLQKEVEYYEKNVDLVWKRRIRPEKLIADKSKSVEKSTTPTRIVNPAKDLLITSQLRTAMILSKNIKATNYNIDTYKKKIFIYGIALNDEERQEVIDEAKSILDVEKVVASIFLVEDLRIQKN